MRSRNKSDCRLFLKKDLVPKEPLFYESGRSLVSINKCTTVKEIFNTETQSKKSVQNKMIKILYLSLRFTILSLIF